MQCLKLKYEETQMRKRCPVSTWCDLNDFHAQYGRLILGVYDFPMCFTAAWSWLAPQRGHMDSFPLWHGCNGIEGLIWSPWFHLLQVVWSQMRRLLSWKCFEKLLLQESSWRSNQANTGKHIGTCKVLHKHRAFYSVDYLGLFLFSALAFWLSPWLVCFYNCPEVSLIRSLLPSPLWPWLTLRFIGWGTGKGRSWDCR